MIRVYSILTAGLLAACVLAPKASADDAKPTENVPATKNAAPAAAKPKRELSPALATLRDLVRQTLAMQQKQPFNTQQNSTTEIMSYCLGFGCNTEVSVGGADGQRINGIACLCCNYPCGGYELLTRSENHIAARIGYGYQEHPGEFLAMLALSRVPGEYSVRLGKETRAVADLVESEKLACRSGSDMSLRLIGLSYYVELPAWKNDLGETWSIERIIRDEIAQPVVTAPEGGLNRLLGLSYAVTRRAKRGQPIDGQFERAEKYTADFQSFALVRQNYDGSWGPQFLTVRSMSADAADQLRATGRVLEWLTISMPDQKLEGARVTKAVEYVANTLASQTYQYNAPSLSTREIAAMGHALHALNLYDTRVFKPADPPPEEKPAADKQPATASRDATSAE